MLRMTRPDTDDELFTRMRAGDESAFTLLYRRWQGALFRFVLRLSGSAEVAEDVVQEVFLVLMREMCSYDPERGKLASYLYGVARNKLWRRLERERPFVELLANDGCEDQDGPAPNGHQEDALNKLVREESSANLWTAVRGLPHSYREALISCDLQELSYEDAAQVLECPIGTVRSRLHRGRRLLAEKLLRQEFEPGRRAVAG
jgi:RNA polymerase sigma-70 factor, ECF subfamily